MPQRINKIGAISALKQINVPRHLKLWRQRKTRESGERFTQEMAAGELRIPVGTYIGYEQGHRTPRTAAYQYLLDKTSQ